MLFSMAGLFEGVNLVVGVWLFMFVRLFFGACWLFMRLCGGGRKMKL
jgi:hypothetical protein